MESDSQVSALRSLHRDVNDDDLGMPSLGGRKSFSTLDKFKRSDDDEEEDDEDDEDDDDKEDDDDDDEEERLKTFLKKEFVDASNKVELPRADYVPDANLANAINDAFVLSRSFRNTPYDAKHPDVELPVNTWALYVRARDRQNPGKCPPLTLRIRPASVTGMILEVRMVPQANGSWNILEAGDGPSKFSSLTAVIKQLRREAELRSALPQLREPQNLTVIDSYMWLGDEFLGPDGQPSMDTVTGALTNQNAAVWKQYYQPSGILKPGQALITTDFEVPIGYVFLGQIILPSARYVAGYHFQSKAWFLFHQHHAYARVSYSLQQLIRSITAGV